MGNLIAFAFFGTLFTVLVYLIFFCTPIKLKAKHCIVIFVLYVLLFLLFKHDDFYVFDKVNVKENLLSHEKISEIISDTSLKISGDDLLKLGTVDDSYYSNGRILLCSSNGILILHENTAEFIECAVLESNKVPDEISTKSAVQLGVFIDNKNRPYIVYKLVKKTSFFGSYKFDKYALYNLVEEKIDDYCDELPDWAKY